MILYTVHCQDSSGHWHRFPITAAESLTARGAKKLAAARFAQKHGRAPMNMWCQ